MNNHGIRQYTMVSVVILHNHGIILAVNAYFTAQKSWENRGKIGAIPRFRRPRGMDILSDRARAARKAPEQVADGFVVRGPSGQTAFEIAKQTPLLQTLESDLKRNRCMKNFLSFW